MGSDPTTFRRPEGFEGAFHPPGSPELPAYAGAEGPVFLPPAAAAVPRDVADLRRLVRWAGAEGLPLVPRGAGTGMPGGNVGTGVAVDLARPFREIGPVDADSRRIAVGAGAVAADVDRAARARGLFLPPLPSSADRCTIGGMVANDAAGARSFGYGTVREWVVELECVLADGRTVRLRPDGAGEGSFAGIDLGLEPAEDGSIPGWPRVRKNSSGYALDRFLPRRDPVQLVVGSEGTLALVTGAVLELAPLPEARGLLLAGLRSLDGLPPLVRAARERGAIACEHFGRRFLELARRGDADALPELPGEPTGIVLLEVAGSGVAVEEGLAALRRTARELDLPTRIARREEERERLWSLRHAASPTIAAAAREGLVSMQLIEDSVVPPERVADYVRGLRRILDEARFDAVIFGHAGDGNIHVNPLVPVSEADWRARVRRVLDATTELVSGLGGTLSGEHGDGRVRAPLLPRIWPRELVNAFRTVKETLDPDGILNPGVVLPLPGQDPLEGLGEGMSRKGPAAADPPDDPGGRPITPRRPPPGSDGS